MKTMKKKKSLLPEFGTHRSNHIRVHLVRTLPIVLLELWKTGQLTWPEALAMWFSQRLHLFLTIWIFQCFYQNQSHWFMT